MVIHKDRVTDCTPGTDSKYGVCWSKIVRGNFKKYVPKEQVVEPDQGGHSQSDLLKMLAPPLP